MRGNFVRALVLSSCVTACAGLGLSGLVVGTPAARQAPQGDTWPAPGRDAPDAARKNREAIENGLLNGGTVQLDNGIYFLDRAIKLDERHSRGVLRGRGTGTVLRNLYTPSPYLDNCTLVAYPLATGYNEPFENVQKDSVRIPEAYPWDANARVDLGNFRPGEVIYSYAWNGYWYDGWMEYTRLVVKSVDAGTRRVVFESGAPSGTEDSLKWCRGHACKDVRAGDTTVELEDLKHLENYRVGQDVYVTSGTGWGHEVTGEYRRVVRIREKLHVDRPLGRSYEKACVLKGPFLTDFTVEDLFLDNPVNLQSNPLVWKFTVRCAFRRVLFGDCLSAAFGTSGYVTVDGCDVPGYGGLGVNACHDFFVRGSRLAGLNCEESCDNVSLADCLVMTVNGVHGVQGHLNCSRIEVRNCTVEGFGYNRGAGNGSPFSFGGKDCRIIDTVVRNTNPTTGSYLWGDNFQIRGLDCDTPVLMTAGTGWRVTNSRAVYWWPFENDNVGDGRYSNVDGRKLGRAWEGSGLEQTYKGKQK